MKKNIFFIISIVILSVTLSTIGCNKKPEDKKTLCPITKISTSTVENRVHVEWDAPNCGSVISYKLYRNDTLHKTLTETSFSEEVYSIGNYYYCVSVVYDEGESEKECTIAIVTEMPEYDCAEIVAGDYMGTLTFLTETNENVTISLTYVEYNTITFTLNNVISYQGMNIPLNINKETNVTLINENKYGFNFDDIVETPSMGTFFIHVIGVVENEILTVHVTVIDVPILGSLDVYFTGNKQ